MPQPLAREVEKSVADHPRRRGAYLLLIGALATISAAGLLPACSAGSPIKAAMAKACLLVASEGEFKTVEGYPLQLLQEIARAQGGSARMEAGGVLTLSLPDRQGRRTDVIRLETQSGPSGYQTTQCGPASIVITRIAINGEIREGGNAASDLTAFINNMGGRAGLPSPTLVAAPPTGSRVNASAAAQHLRHEETAGEYDDGHGYPEARLSGCGPKTCSWSRVVERDIAAVAGGTSHRLRIVEGSTWAGDVDRAHVRWDASAHDVTVDCSLTQPAVVTGAQRDELQLKATGSSVPTALNASYRLYAAECHPEAADLDPTNLARRYGYKAGSTPTVTEYSVDAQAQAFRRAQQQRDQASAARAHVAAEQQADAQRARLQATESCREAYERVYAGYINHPTKEGGDAVTRASATRNACEAAVEQRWGSGG